MLADSTFAESYKFLRNRSALFWGFGAVPLTVLLFNLMLDTWLKTHLHLPSGIDLGQQIVRTMGLGGSSFFQIFYVAGAASLFAGEYRWETWRLLTPRNSRANLLVAKFMVYAFASGLSLLAMGVVGAFLTLYGSMLGGATTLPGLGFLGAAAGVFFATWAELMVLGAVTALVAIGSRAMIAALLAGIVFSFAQWIAMALVHPWEAPLNDFVLLPGMSAYLLRACAAGQEIAPGIYADPAKVAPAAAILMAWIVAPGAAALVLFQTQDLPRE